MASWSAYLQSHCAHLPAKRSSRDYAGHKQPPGSAESVTHGKQMKINPQPCTLYSAVRCRFQAIAKYADIVKPGAPDGQKARPSLSGVGREAACHNYDTCMDGLSVQLHAKQHVAWAQH